jgi:hypothetical protein
MSERETNAMNRRELHASREHLMTVERPLTFARMDAQRASHDEIAEKISLAEALLNEAKMRIVDLLRTN